MTGPTCSLAVGQPRRPGPAAAPIRSGCGAGRPPTADRGQAGPVIESTVRSFVNHQSGKLTSHRSPFAVSVSIGIPHYIGRYRPVPYSDFAYGWTRRRAMFPHAATDDVGDSPPTMPTPLPGIRSERTLCPFGPQCRLQLRCLTRTMNSSEPR